MIRAAAAVLALAGLPWGWLAAASWLFLLITGQSDKFSFPYVQWALVAPYWRSNWWVTLCVVVAAIAPTVVFGLIGLVWVRRSAKRQPIYGTSTWAKPAESARGGIASARSPFDA